MPGGDGMLSETVLQITVDRNSPSMPQYYTDDSGFGGGGLDASGLER